MKLDLYRRFRHDCMINARIAKKDYAESLMLAHIKQAKGWHKLIMQNWQDEQDEHNQIVQSAKEHGIILE